MNIKRNKAITQRIIQNMYDIHGVRDACQEGIFLGDQLLDSISDKKLAYCLVLSALHRISSKIEEPDNTELADTIAKFRKEVVKISAMEAVDELYCKTVAVPMIEPDKNTEDIIKDICRDQFIETADLYYKAQYDCLKKENGSTEAELEQLKADLQDAKSHENIYREKYQRLQESRDKDIQKLSKELNAAEHRIKDLTELLAARPDIN